MLQITPTLRLSWDKAGCNVLLQQFQKISPKGKDASAPRNDWVTLGYYPNLAWFKGVCKRYYTLLTRGYYDKQIKLAGSDIAKENWTNEKKFATEIALHAVANDKSLTEKLLGDAPSRQITEEHKEKLKNGKRTGKAKAANVSPASPRLAPKHVKVRLPK